MAGCIKVATIDRPIGLSALSIAAAPLQQLGRLAGQPHLGTHHILQPQLQPLSNGWRSTGAGALGGTGPLSAPWHWATECTSDE